MWGKGRRLGGWKRLGGWRSVGDGGVWGMGRSLREWSLGSGVVCGVCDWGETRQYVGETAVGYFC